MMWLSMLSVWGSLLTLVASQSCPDASENSASWVRLKPLGQCKDGESTCPYRITLPPLTIQLPKPFRELEKMARELQSLTQMVNELKEDCRVCKERQGMDWNVRKDGEGEDGERIQAFRGALNTKEREQDIAERESTVQVTTPRSALEDTMIVSSNAKDVKPTAFGKQRNTNQERNVNPRTTKPRAETKQWPKGSNPLQKNQKKVSLGKIGYPVVTVVTEGDDDDDVVETTQLQTPKGDKVLGKKRLVTGTDAQNNRELEPNMKPLTRKQQDKEDKKEEAVDTGLKDSRSNITEDTNNGNVAKEGSVGVIQQPTLKNKGKNEKNNHGDGSTMPKPLKPGGYSERDAEVNSRSRNTDDTIRGQKKLTSPITGRANASVNVSQINPQTLEIKSENAFKSDIDAKMDTGIKSKFIKAETGSGRVVSRSPISGTTYDTVDVSPTNPQTLDSKRQLATAPGSESGAGINSNTAETVSGLKKSRSPISDRTNATADVDLISPKRESSNSQTSSKSSKNAELNTGMDSNPVNKTETVHGHEMSRSPISGITDGIFDVHPTNPQILDTKTQFTTGTDSETDAVMDSNPVNNVDTINRLKNSRSPISGRPHATGDMDLMNPEKQSSTSQTAVKSSKESNIGMNSNPINRLKNSRSPISGSTDGTVDASPRNPQIVQSKNQLEASKDSMTEARVGSNPVKNVETIIEEQTSRSPISSITDGIVDVHPTNPQILDTKNQFTTGTDSETDAVMDSNPVNNVDTINRLKNSRSPISGRPHATGDMDLMNPKKQSSTSQTAVKSSKERNIGMNSNPINKLKNSRSPVSGSTDDTVDGSPRNPQIVQNKNQLEASTDSMTDARVGSNPVKNVDTIIEEQTSRSPISGITDGIVDVHPTNPQILDTKNQFTTGTDSETDAVMDSNPVNNVDTINRLKNSRSPISGRPHATGDMDLMNPKKQSSNSQTAVKSSKERNIGMNSNPINRLKNSRSPISGSTDGTVDASPRNPQIVQNKNQLEASTDSRTDARVGSNPVKNVETTSEEQTSRSPISGITDGIADVHPTNPQILDTKNQFTTGTDSETDAVMDSNPVNNVDTINRLKNSRSPISGRPHATGDMDLMNPKKQSSTSQTAVKSSKERNIGMNSNPINKLKNSRSPVSGSTDGTVDASPRNPQRVQSKNQLEASTDSRTDARVGSNPVKNVETTSEEQTSRSPISGITDGIADVHPTNPHILDTKNQFTTGTDSETDAVMDSNPVNNVDTINRLKNSRSPISGRPHATGDMDLMNPKKQSSNSQTAVKSSKERNIGMNSNPINRLKNSRSPISGSTDGTVDASPRNPQIVQNKNQLEASTDSRTDARVGSNPVKNVETTSEEQTSRSPISGITDGIADASPTDLQILDGKNQFRTGTESESDAVKYPNPVIATVTEQMNSSSSISDRANYTADLDLINPLSLNSQNPFTHGTDVKSNTGMDSHPFNTSETVSRRQTPKSPISDRTDTDEVNQAYPGTLDGTFKNPFKSMINKERKAGKDSNPLNTVETNGPLEMPQLTIKGRADATVNVNPQIVYSNSENATVVSTPVNKVEIPSHRETPKTPISDRDHAATDQINPQAMDSKKRLKLGTISERKTGMHPNRHNTTDTGSQRETSESPVSDSRLDVSDTTPSLNSKDGLPKRRFLPKPKLNMTQPRNGQINPMSIDMKRKKALMSNKTTSLRSDVITRGRHPPTRLGPRKLVKQQEIKNQPERISPTTRLNLYKDRSRKKPYIFQRKPYILRGNPINETEASGPGGSANTSGVIDYTMSKETTHVDSKTVSSPNNKLNSTAYDTSHSVMPTLATQDIVDQAQLKRAKTAPTIEVLHKIINHQMESTSQTTVIKPRLAKPGSSSGQDLVLDTVNNTGRDSQPPVVAETKGTGRRTGQTKFKTSRVDSNQENHKKPLRLGSIQNLGGKMPVVSSEKNELNYPTTAATPYTTKAEFKDKYSKMSQFTPTTRTPPHFMDQNHAKQAKTTSGAKVSNQNVHHRLKNSSQEMEPKRSHSDTGNKKLQNASNGQESNVVTDFQPSSLDSIQNRTTGSMAIIMDKVKASAVSKVSTKSKDSTNENRAKDSNPVVIDKFEASTESNWVTPALNNAPFKDHRYSKTPTGSDGSGEHNNGGHPIDNNNNGNFNPVAVNRMTGATLHKIPAGHTNNEDNKKPLTISNMDDRQALEKQLLSNCHGPCDLGPTLQSALNSRESSDNKRDKPPQDCSDFILRNPTSGIYNVTPAASDNRTFPVFCEMKSSGGGWTLIQHRFDGSISFNRTWNDYKKGFGNLSGEFWLGNDKIHWLTTTKAMVLRIELEDLDGMKEYAQYDHFHVANESQFYRLMIDGYSGTAGNAMQYSKKFSHNQKNFTTPDRDNDQYASGNCGTYYSSGWWFGACFAANLNGKYYETKYRGVRNGIFWGTWHNITTEYYPTHDRQSFKTVRMMIRPRTGLLMD